MAIKDDSERCAPWNRLINGHPLLVDLQELRQMSPADKAHYAGGATRTQPAEASNRA